MKKDFFNLFSIEIRRNPRFYQENIEFKNEYNTFLELSSKNSDFIISDNYPCLEDKYESGGTAKGHYFHQDLYIARRIYESQPIKHVDIGSRFDGFVSHVATFRDIEVFDIRNIDVKVKNIKFVQADLMNIPTGYIDYTDSISCLHALEHFGLGRYGDTLDPDGYKKGFLNITSILKSGGTFYFSVPMSFQQRIEFNAHRIFSLSYLIPFIEEYYNINNFSYIDDKGDFHESVNLNVDVIQKSFNCWHGCAVFELIKK